MGEASVYVVVLVESGCISFVEAFAGIDDAEKCYARLEEDMNENDDSLGLYDGLGCIIDCH